MYSNLIKEIENKPVQLVAVSKTRTNEAIMSLYHQGQRIFGENRVKDMEQKYEDLPKDIKWHFIGHLQSKKVKYIASFVEMIHSVDSIKLLEEINKQAQKHDRTIKVLLQFKIAREESKYGLQINDIIHYLNTNEYEQLSHIEIVGVMGMATFTHDKNQIRNEFKQLKNIFENLKSNSFQSKDSFKEISMGMSGDYHIAIEEGSTILRIGSLLFQ